VQRLVDAPRAAVPDVVRALGGIQSQDRNASLLAVGARTPAATVADVEHALRRDRSVVRTWAMRGTIHLVAADDLPLVLAIFGPFILRRLRRRLAELGLPPDAAERSTAQAADVLADAGPLTRHELAERLRGRGVPVAAAGQAPVMVVCRAAVAGVLVEVGVRGRDPLYHRLDPGPLPDRDAALAELARRYEAAHAPAGIDDFAAWSGLPVADVRRGWQAVSPRRSEPPGPGPVRLLPAYDEWLLGWASRDFTLPAEHARAPLPGGGIVRPVALADGRVFASWRLNRPKRRVEVRPFGRLSPAMRDGLAAEVAAIGRFLGMELALEAP
jgi:hypothetical protein